MLTALRHNATRCLRAACRAGRDAVDACTTSLQCPSWDSEALLRVAPRLNLLQHLEVHDCIDDEDPPLPRLLAPPALPALASLTVGGEVHGCAGYASDDGVPELLAALAALTRLTALDLSLPGSDAQCRLALALGGQLTALRKFAFETDLENAPVDSPAPCWLRTQVGAQRCMRLGECCQVQCCLSRWVHTHTAAPPPRPAVLATWRATAASQIDLYRY